MSMSTPQVCSCLLEKILIIYLHLFWNLQQVFFLGQVVRVCV